MVYNKKILFPFADLGIPEYPEEEIEKFKEILIKLIYKDMEKLEKKYDKNVLEKMRKRFNVFLSLIE